MCITKDGQIQVVKEVSVEKLDEPVRVYNLEVDNQHTYYVSDSEVLVHNECTWNKGSFDTPDESLQYHYEKHKDEQGDVIWISGKR